MDKTLNVLLSLDGGQGRDVVDAIASTGRDYRLFSFDEAGRSPFGPLHALKDLGTTTDADYFIARRLDDVAREIRDGQLRDLVLSQVIHAHAYISPHAELGQNTFVGAKAVVNPQARLGDFVFVNAGCLIDHDCVIGSGTSLGPGVTFPGFVSIGENCAIGAGVVARPGVTVAPGCTLGAGAVIARDITEPGVYIGNPAHPLERK